MPPILPVFDPFVILPGRLVARFQAKRFLKLLKRVVKQAEPGLHHSQIQMRQGIAWFEPDDLRVFVFCVADLIDHHQLIAQRKMY